LRIAGLHVEQGEYAPSEAESDLALLQVFIEHFDKKAVFRQIENLYVAT